MKYDAPSDKIFDLLDQPTDWQYPHWFRCPDCKELSGIDLDQYQGTGSIVCGCGWYGYRQSG